jgi:uncharacterized protein (DUF58 family)
MKKDTIKMLYLTQRWYICMAIAVVVFFISFFFPWLLVPAALYTCSIVLLSIIDILLLFNTRGIEAQRHLPPRFSLGDDNVVRLDIRNKYHFRVNALIIDEQPEQLQERNFSITTHIDYQSNAQHTYHIRPLTRGVYAFGQLLCYISSPIGFIQRRFHVAGEATVKVYPSFQQLKKYNLLAISGASATGLKKVRRLGHSLEFEKIKNYVPGDDVRTINWKATARNTSLMVNMFTDIRQQQVYCLIDKSRVMKMPFDGLTLLDYAINASLALLNVVLLKQDRAGFIGFADMVTDIVAAERRNGQLNHIMEGLYNQQTLFKESDYEHLLGFIHKRVTQRSCLLLFTNFETYAALERQLPYLKKLASRHLLCVIFFQNTMLKEIHETQPDTIEGIYIKTIADRFDFEKKQIVKELRRHGILSVLTTPQQLTVNIINKYLELKARQML